MEQEQQQELRAAQEANQILTLAREKAQQQLAVGTQKANWRNLISLVGIGVAIAVAEIAVPGLLHAESVRQTAETKMQNASKQKDELVMLQAQFQGREPWFSSDSKLVLTKDGKTNRLYDPTTGKKQSQFEGSYPRFSPDGKQIVAKDDKAIWLYDLTGKKLAEFRYSK